MICAVNSQLLGLKWVEIIDLINFFVFSGMSRQLLLLWFKFTLYSITASINTTAHFYCKSFKLWIRSTALGFFQCCINDDIKLSTTIKTTFEIDSAIYYFHKLIHEGACSSTPDSSIGLYKTPNENLHASTEIHRFLKEKRRL